MKNKDLVESLRKLESFTLFGSRALGVATEESDYNIAIHISDLPNTFKDALTEGRDLGRYFSVLPKEGGFKINTHKGVDLVVLNSRLDLALFTEAVHRLKDLPKWTLTNKQLRIALFEEQLLHLGFTQKGACTWRLMD